MKIALVALATAATVTSAIDPMWLDTVRPQEGEEIAPLGGACSQFDWQETQEVQAAFHEHQYVEDCGSPDARFLVLRTWKIGGLASVMQEVATALHVAHVTKRTLLFQGEGQVGAETKWNLAGPECGSRTMDCFFEPLSNCRLEDVVDEDTPNVYLTPDGYLHPKVQEVRVAFIKRPKLNAWNRDMPNKWMNQGKKQFWWFSQLSAFAFRPLPHVIEAAANFARAKNPALSDSVWNSGTKTLALHVRSGDRYKNHAKAALIDSLNAHESGKSESSFAAWFLATDDGHNLVEAEAFATEYPSAPPIFWDPEEDRREKVVIDIETKDANATALTIEAAKNIILLAAANRLTGTRHSQFSKLAGAVGCAVGRFVVDPDSIPYVKTDERIHTELILPHETYHEAMLTIVANAGRRRERNRDRSDKAYDEKFGKRSERYAARVDEEPRPKPRPDNAMHASRNLEPVVAVSLDERITKAEALARYRDGVQMDLPIHRPEYMDASATEAETDEHGHYRHRDHERHAAARENARQERATLGSAPRPETRRSRSRPRHDEI